MSRLTNTICFQVWSDSKVHIDVLKEKCSLTAFSEFKAQIGKQYTSTRGVFSGKTAQTFETEFIFKTEGTNYIVL